MQGIERMIKKIAILLWVMFVPFMTFAADYSEGKHYTKVNEQATAKKEIREYFSFYCQHCLKFEPFMATVKKKKSADVNFERNHVDFLRAAPAETQQLLSKAVVIAQQLNVEEKIVAAIFNYIQVQRATFSSINDVRNLFVLHDVDGDKFDKLAKSFSVNSQAKKMKKNQDDLTSKRALNAVPTLIINGKYRINTQELSRDNFMEDYQNLINYLLTLS